MLFNPKKKSETLNLSIDGVSLKHVSNTKFLGVWIDENLCWRSHVDKVIIKLKQNKNLLKVGQKFLNVHAKKLVYFAHIQSHIVYCLSIWGSMISNTQLSKIQSIQDSCIKLIDSRKTNVDLGILTVNNLLELENLKFCYKYLQDALPKNVSYCVGTDPYGNSLSKKHGYNTCNKLIPNKPKANCSR